MFLEGARNSGASRWTTSCSTGLPGLGKTTLAHVIAREMERADPGDLRALDREGRRPGGHPDQSRGRRDPLRRRDPPARREPGRGALPALEDRALDLVVGSGPAARTVRLELPPFTFVGATTRYGLLSPPLRDRFGIVHHLDYYDTEEPRRDRPRSAGSSGRARGPRAPWRSPAAPVAHPASPTACYAVSATSSRSRAARPSPPSRPPGRPRAPAGRPFRPRPDRPPPAGHDPAPLRRRPGGSFDPRRRGRGGPGDDRGDPRAVLSCRSASWTGRHGGGGLPGGRGSIWGGRPPAGSSSPTCPRDWCWATGRQPLRVHRLSWWRR